MDDTTRAFVGSLTKATLKKLRDPQKSLQLRMPTYRLTEDFCYFFEFLKTAITLHFFIQGPQPAKSLEKIRRGPWRSERAGPRRIFEKL